MLISPSTLQVDQPSSCHINSTRHPGPSLWLQIERQLMICKTVLIRRSTTFFVIGLTLYSLCPSWVPSCGLRLGAAAEHEIYESLSVCLPLRLDIFHLLKTCHPVSSGVSRMRNVALCLRRHGITMQMGQWNLSQGKLLPPIESFICCRPLLPATDHCLPQRLLQWQALKVTTRCALLDGVKLDTCRK